MSCRINAAALPSSFEPCYAASLLVLLRVVRVWNQTGQKHAGEPDIARTVLPAHNMLLWLLVLITYGDVVQRLSRRAVPWASRSLATAASLALGVATLGFKLAFTKADTPELFAGLEYLAVATLEEASLVAQARAVFTSIAIMMMLTSFPVAYQRIRGGGEIKGRTCHMPIETSAHWRHSRYLAASPRPLHPFPSHSVPSHECAPVSFARITIPSAGSPSTFQHRIDIDVATFPIRIVFCLWRIQCHLLD